LMISLHAFDSVLPKALQLNIIPPSKILNQAKAV